MDKLDIFLYRFVKIDEFGWWDLEKKSADAGTKFTSMYFMEEIRSVHLKLSAPEHQEITGQVEVTWRKLRTIAHSLMVHVRVSESYIHFALMYITDNIFPVLPIKYLIK